MTTFDYGDLAATAAELLEEFGQAVTLLRPSTSPATYDADTSVATPVAPATYAGMGVQASTSQGRASETGIRRASRRYLVTLTDSTITPQTGDMLTVAGTVYSVIGSDPVMPAATRVVHQLDLEGVG